jgi:hypothetical protein
MPPIEQAALAPVEASRAEQRRDIAAIVADFRTADEALNADLAEEQKYERQIDNIKGKLESARDRAERRRIEMGRLVWEARQWWETARHEDPGIAKWGRFSEEQFGKSRAEINRLLKIGKADDPAEQLRAERERDRERKRAATTQVVAETPNSETHLGDIADGREPVASPTWAASLIGGVAQETSSEQITVERCSLILDEVTRMLRLSRHPADDIRDIVCCFVDARVDEIPEPMREELVRDFAEVMGVAITLESAPPQEVADATN